MVKHHSQLARLGRDHRIDRRTEIHYQSWGSGPGDLGCKVDRDIADEQPARGFMEFHRRTQESRHQGSERSQRDQASATIEDETAGKIKSLALDSYSSIAVREFSVDIVVTNFPRSPIRSRCDRAQRGKDLQQIHVIAVALDNRERVVGGGRINRKLFRLRCAGKKNSGSEQQGNHQAGSQSAVV